MVLIKMLFLAIKFKSEVIKTKTITTYLQCVTDHCAEPQVLPAAPGGRHVARAAAHHRRHQRRA